MGKKSFNKGIVGIIIGIIVVAAALTGLVVYNNNKHQKSFMADGYILNVPENDNVEAITENCEQIYFSAGTPYGENYNSQIVFKNTSDQQVVLNPAQYIHYQDESLGSFTKGVIMDMDALETEQYGYYSITKNTVVVKNGNNYVVTTKGEQMNLGEFLWKISDKDYMIVSPTLTLSLGGDYTVLLDGYAQIRYVDNGIVRIIHQQGTYQTVSEQAYIETANGDVLNLAGKNFYSEGQPVLNLDSIALGDDSYIKIDENIEDQPTIPTFNVVNGQDGANGLTGEVGDKGEQGEEGEEGKQGEEGQQGEDGELGEGGKEGEQGIQGTQGEDGKIGATGTQGTQGEQGTKGEQGTNGDKGTSGDKGTDGDQGTKGQDGAQGSQGEQGTQGVQGQAGNAGNQGATGGDGENGAAGSSGKNGSDGLTGEAGMLGYDGKDGKEGKDGKRDDPSGDVPVDLNAQPEVSLDADNYKVTPGSADMTLELTDTDGSLETGSVTVTLYNKETMEVVAVLPSETAQSLEQGMATTLNFTGLQAGTEYLVQVVGSYVMQEGDSRTVVLYNKTFRTQELGIELSKDSVTDIEVFLRGVKTASDISTYDVILFTEHDSEGKPIINDNYRYTWSKLDTSMSSNQIYRYADNVPNTGNVINSNTQYYAYISNVNIEGSTDPVDLAYSETEISFKTLKEKPYQVSVSESSARTPVEYVKPLLKKNDKDGTMTLSTSAFTDKDKGIKSYRYELYKVTNVSANGIVEPDFVATSDALMTQTFNIPAGDVNNYIGRIILVFDDNEKQVEYATMFSDPVNLSNSAFPVVEFVVSANSVYHDKFSGHIRVTDNGGKINDFVSNTNPLVLTIVSEYDDVFTITINDDNVTKNGKVWYYYFEKEGLRTNTDYTLTVTGPVDTDGNTVIDASEKKTYLAGYRLKTKDNIIEQQGIAAKDIPVSSKAFNIGLMLCAPIPDSPSVNAADHEYQVSVLNELILELVHKKDNGQIDVIGETTIKNGNIAETHDSTFLSNNYASADMVFVNEENGTLSLSSNAPVAKMIELSPSSFGKLDNQDVFYSGGEFIIRVKEATDYTSHKNNIYFKEGQDLYSFKVVKKHVQSKAPYSEAQIRLIQNIDADAGHNEEGAADDTIVGMTVQAKYSYKDATAITYYIYQLDDGVLVGSEDNIYPSMAGSTNSYKHETSTVYGGNENAYAYREDGTKIGKLVAYTTIENKTAGDNNTSSIAPVRIYFKDLAFVNPEGIGTHAGDSWTGVDVTNIERGHRYFVCYTVKGSDQNGQIDCENDNHPDIYPFCTYDLSDHVPYYRSDAVEVKKQIPVIQRYLSSTASNTAIWMYKILDPDMALEKGASDGKIKYYQTINTNTPVAKELKLSDYADYAALTLGNFSNGNKYKIDFKYKLSDTAELVTISSVPVVFSTYATPGDIKVMTAETGEPAIYDEGGYKFRITLVGNDIDKLAAVRVTIKGIGDGGSEYTAVYDPVYVSIMGQVVVSGATKKFGYVNLDTSGMSSLIDKNVTEATVSVEGYYAAGPAGVESYQASSTDIPSSTKDFSNQTNIFAIKRYNDIGEEEYVTENGGSFVPLDNIGRSLYVPGLKTKVEGFSVTDKEFNARFVENPMVLLNDNYSKDINNSIEFDQSGMKIGEKYYYPVKIATKAITFADTSESNINISEIQPAIRLNDISVGANSFHMIFEALGAGANSSNKIFMRISKIDGAGQTYLHLDNYQHSENQNATIYTMAKTVADSDEYDYANNSGHYIEVDTSSISGKFLLPISIQGLEINTKYRIELFAYDKNHVYKKLYSFDKDATGFEYEYTTLKAIDSDVISTSLKTITYTNKYYDFGFRVRGDDGANIKVYYTVMDSTNNVILGYENILLAPIHDGALEYYSQDPSKNNKIIVDVNPGGPFKAGEEYKVEAVIKSSSDEEMGRSSCKFVIPEEFKAPSFVINSNSEKGTTGEKVNITITCENEMRSIYNNEYTVKLVHKKTGDETESKTVIANNASNVNTVTFDNLLEGEEYQIIVNAKYDEKNEGITGCQNIEIKSLVETGGAVRANVGFTLYTDSMELILTGRNNFADVATVLCTVYPDGKANPIVSKTFNLSDMVNEAITIPYPSSQKAGTAVTIKLQYRTASGEVIGEQDAPGKIVPAVNPDPIGADTMSADTFSLFSRQRDNALLKDVRDNVSNNSLSDNQAEADKDNEANEEDSASVNKASVSSNKVNHFAVLKNNSSSESKVINSSNAREKSLNKNIVSENKISNANEESGSVSQNNNDNNSEDANGETDSNTNESGENSNGITSNNSSNALEDNGANKTEEAVEDASENKAEEPGDDASENKAEEPGDDASENKAEEPGEDASENKAEEPGDDASENNTEDSNAESSESNGENIEASTDNSDEAHDSKVEDSTEAPSENNGENN